MIRRTEKLRLAAGAIVLAGLGLGMTAGAANASDELPQSVTADYKVSFAGVDIGWFKFRSNLSGGRYKASGDAKIRLLFGGLKWSGKMTGTGRLSQSGPRPASYSQKLVSKRKLVFKTKKKTKRASITYRRGRVSQSDVTPPLKTGKGRAPFRDEHFRGVLDPVAAVLALTVDDASNPCNRRIPLFDGRQRMDIVLSFKKRVRVKARDNQPSRGFACSVRYVPIAGHKIRDKSNRDLASRRDITLVLRAVRGAGVFIPYEVSVPTAAGTAVIRATKVNITTQANDRIALRG